MNRYLLTCLVPLFPLTAFAKTYDCYLSARPKLGKSAPTTAIEHQPVKLKVKTGKVHVEVTAPANLKPVRILKEGTPDFISHAFSLSALSLPRHALSFTVAKEFYPNDLFVRLQEFSQQDIANDLENSENLDKLDSKTLAGTWFHDAEKPNLMTDAIDSAGKAISLDLACFSENR